MSKRLKGSFRVRLQAAVEEAGKLKDRSAKALKVAEAYALQRR